MHKACYRVSIAVTVMAAITSTLAQETYKLDKIQKYKNFKGNPFDGGKTVKFLNEFKSNFLALLSNNKTEDDSEIRKKWYAHYMNYVKPYVMECKQAWKESYGSVIELKDRWKYGLRIKVTNVTGTNESVDHLRYYMASDEQNNTTDHFDRMVIYDDPNGNMMIVKPTDVTDVTNTLTTNTQNTLTEMPIAISNLGMEEDRDNQTNVAATTLEAEAYAIAYSAEGEQTDVTDVQTNTPTANGKNTLTEIPIAISNLGMEEDRDNQTNVAATTLEAEEYAIEYSAEGEQTDVIDVQTNTPTSNAKITLTETPTAISNIGMEGDRDNQTNVAATTLEAEVYATEYSAEGTNQTDDLNTEFDTNVDSDLEGNINPQQEDIM